ncbi:MAG: prepilin-type N-terminal cleavage/methylation domain-containing protein [Candidatus Gracilibacteria bacterium]|nr:prepilin-type N-terminal cleavage/methylation domain-containing protein [Candidatus Gracilibacteria bacterium]
MNTINITKKGFSIIEILVGIFIFSMGIAGVYAIISSTLRINDLNKNYIIAVNLANEQIELVRNIRDSNYKKIQKYNMINPSSNNYTNVFEYGKKYKIENNYSDTADFPIQVIDITDGFEQGVDKLNGVSMQKYIICIDSLNRYTHDCNNPNNKKTKFYKYISFEKVTHKEGTNQIDITDAYLVTSKVIWYIRGYHEFEIKSIVADWKRL